MDPVIGLISTNYSNVNDFGVLLERRCFGSLPFGGRYRLIDFALSSMKNAGMSCSAQATKSSILTSTT